MLTLGLPNTSLSQTKSDSPHKRQLAKPDQMLELDVSETATQIVSVSTMDLNVLITPFEVVKVTHNSSEIFTIDKNKIYFQASSTDPFSVFVTEEGDHKAPQFKIMLVPTEVPLGQKIMLKPRIPYTPKRSRYTDGGEMIKKADTYTESIIDILSSTAKYLATSQLSMLPDSYSIDDDYVSSPYYIGNTLMQPEFKLTGTHYDVYVMTANNRSNQNLQLSPPDFAKMTPATGLLEESTMDTMAVGVGFYPRKVIQPGQSTQIILIRPSQR